MSAVVAEHRKMAKYQSHQRRRVVVPKVDAPKDLHFVTDVLRQLLPERHAVGSEDPVKIVALVESARSVMDLNTICKASPYLSGLTFAAEDFARSSINQQTTIDLA